MNRISLYAARHTDEAHIREFFSKKLLREGEQALAMFDGVFYEAKNERVGGLAFHDYLVISNAAIYMWARGVAKDYLDRFSLAQVSVAAKSAPSEQHQDYATLNLTIARAGKPPLSLIFDLVPEAEANQIASFAMLASSVIESGAGKNFLGEVPEGVAAEIATQSVKLFPPREVVLGDESSIQEPKYDATAVRATNGYTHIYGQNTLAELRERRLNPNMNPNATPNGVPQSAGTPKYSADFMQGERRHDFAPKPAAFPELDLLTLKRMEAVTRDVLSSIPEEYREQAKRDLERLPSMSNMPQVISALSELLTNISQNEKTQEFVLNAISAAIKSDGLFGMVQKAATMMQQGAFTPDAATAAHQNTDNAAADAAPQATQKPDPIHIRFDDDGTAAQTAQPSGNSLFGAPVETPRKKIKINIG
ncbi:MAG: hypothetical protein IAF08_12470 [Rhizobacter sp.]|nr:hypothetical protein [Chlorobiales bacterium]